MILSKRIVNICLVALIALLATTFVNPVLGAMDQGMMGSCPANMGCKMMMPMMDSGMMMKPSTESCPANMTCMMMMPMMVMMPMNASMNMPMMMAMMPMNVTGMNMPMMVMMPATRPE